MTDGTNARLSIHLLGGLRLATFGQPIDRPRRRESERLLVYLLLHRARQLDRQSTAFALWPDLPADKARFNLRFHLYKLADDLPDVGDGAPWIDRGDRVVGWSSDADTWLDIDAFARLAASGGDDPAVPADAVLARLRAAATLYAGDLLPDHDEPWLIAPREQLRAVAVRVLDELATRELDAGAFAEAVTTAQRRIALDPDEEHGYRLLLRAYGGLADVGALARTLDACRQRMQETFGLDPSADTVALYDALLAAAESPAAPPIVHARATTSVPQPRAAVEGQRLPQPLTSFVGRHDEIARLRELVDGHRLVTILGPGGAGKTRLAVETLRHAAERDDVVRWVDLTELPRHAPVAAAIGRAIGLPSLATTSVDALVPLIGERSLVLALDNCEHVVEPVREAADVLLAGCAGLHILATSREPLSVPGEVRWPIAPLDVPRADDTAREAIARSAAVAMFVDRTSALDATWRPSPDDLHAIAAICRLLDGLPLAIEIAAARTVLLSPAQLRDELTTSLASLGADGDDHRHATLTASVRWSFDLLAPDEQLALVRLAVFPGSFDAAAATAVVGGAPLTAQSAFGLTTRLVEKSLVALQPSAGARRRFALPQPVREFVATATDNIAPDDRQRHAAHFRQLVAATLRDRRIDEVPADTFDALRPDFASIDVALATTESEHGAVAALTMALDVYRYWYALGQLRYASDTLLRLLAAPGADDDPAIAGRAADIAGSLCLWQVDFARAATCFGISLRHARAAGDRRQEARLLGLLGETQLSMLDVTAAERTLGDAVAVAGTLADRDVDATIGRLSALLAQRHGDIEAAHRHWLHALQHATGTAPSGAEARAARFQLARIWLDVAAHRRAEHEIRAGETAASEAGDEADQARWNHLHGIVLTELGAFEAAAAALRAAMERYRAEGTAVMSAWVEDCLAQASLQQGRLDVADAYFRHSLDVKRRADDRMGLVYGHLGVAERHLAGARVESAAAELARATALLGDRSDRGLWSWAQRVAALVLAAQGDGDAALEAAEDALTHHRRAAQRRQLALDYEALAVAHAARRSMAEARTAMATATALWTALDLPRPHASGQLTSALVALASTTLTPEALAEAEAAGAAAGEVEAGAAARRVAHLASLSDA